MAPEKIAFAKGWDVIRSCETMTQLMNAYQWVWLYKNMYGKTKNWENLLNYCTQRRNRL